jgi:hypothetical protein
LFLELFFESVTAIEIRIKILRFLIHLSDIIGILLVILGLFENLNAYALKMEKEKGKTYSFTNTYQSQFDSHQVLKAEGHL